jgi:hypothetical protein
LHCNNDPPESLSPIRSFLIDSGASEPLRAVGCAKLFGCAHMHAANTVNAKCDAFRAKIQSQKRAQGGHRLLQNSLFHNGFCNSVGVRTNFRRALYACAFSSCACREIALQRVGSRSDTRLIKQ